MNEAEDLLVNCDWGGILRFMERNPPFGRICMRHAAVRLCMRRWSSFNKYLMHPPSCYSCTEMLKLIAQDDRERVREMIRRGFGLDGLVWSEVLRLNWLFDLTHRWSHEFTECELSDWMLVRSIRYGRRVVNRHRLYRCVLVITL